MKITIDSTEPLEDALRMLGALYNVALIQSEPAPPPASTAAASNRTRSSGASAEVRGATQAQPRPAALPRTARRRPRTTAAPKTSEVRAWALSNGHHVSDRGPIPASVGAEYARAQTTT